MIILDALVTFIALNAGAASLLLTMIGVSILAHAAVMARRGRAATRALAHEFSSLQASASDERLRAMVGAASWPKGHPALEPIRGALASALAKGAEVPSLDSALRASAFAVGRRGGAVKGLASTLIILSLLATFEGMKGATSSLTGVLGQISGQGQGQAAIGKAYLDFRPHVSQALSAMSTAFGANLSAIFAAAVLLLMLLLLRAYQAKLIEEVRRFVDEEIRVYFSESDQWVERLGRDLRTFVQEFQAANVAAQQENMTLAIGKLSVPLNDLSTSLGELGQLQQKSLEEAVQETHRSTAQVWGQYLRDISQGIGSVVELQKQVLTLMVRDEGRVEATVHRVESIGARVENQLQAFTQAARTVTDAVATRERLEEVERGSRATAEKIAEVVAHAMRDNGQQLEKLRVALDGVATRERLEEVERGSRATAEKMAEAVAHAMRDNGQQLEKLRVALDGLAVEARPDLTLAAPRSWKIDHMAVQGDLPHSIVQPGPAAATADQEAVSPDAVSVAPVVGRS